MSKRINKINIEDLRKKISIVDIISSYISLTRKGNNFVGLCPFHDDKHASLTVNESKKIYKCFSCNNAGDVFTFVKNHDHITYFDAVIKVAKQANVKIENLETVIKHHNENKVFFDINNETSKYFSMFLNNKDAKPIKEYLAKRAINEEIIKFFNIGYAPKDETILIDLLNNKDEIVEGKQGYSLDNINKAGLSTILKDGTYISYFRDRVMFPIRNENDEIVGFSGRTTGSNEVKYLNTATTNIFTKNEILFNLSNVIKDYDVETIYILEGFMDVIALHKMGIKNAVATMGVAFSSNHMNGLSRLPNLKSVIICFDNDDAGKSSITKTAEILLRKYDVYVVDYDQCKYKDIDEIYMNNEQEAKDVINNTIDYATFCIKNLIDNANTNNQAEKDIVIKKVIEIIKQQTNDIAKANNIKYASNKLNIDIELLKELSQTITRANSNYTTKKINYKKYEIPNIELSSKKTNIWKTKTNKEITTENTEREIVKFSLSSKKLFALFMVKSGKLLDKRNQSIILGIEKYYLQNPEDLKIDIKKCTEIFNDTEILGYVARLVSDIELKQVNYSDKKAEQIIATHLTKLKKHDQKLIYEKLAKDPNNWKQIVEINKKINNKK